MEELQVRFNTEIKVLDALITGFDPFNGRGGHDKPIDLPDFVLSSELYYLSDGGYSRLFCDFDCDELTAELHLTSNSLPGAKVRWRDVPIITSRRRIEKLMRLAIQLIEKEEV
jgi:hypothetical protein